MNIFKQLRKEKGITQVELSQLMNVQQTTVSKWEVGRAIPDYSVLTKLADYYSVSIDYLLGRSDDYALTPAEKKHGYTTTPKIELNSKEYEMIIQYRDIGNAENGAAHQALIRKFVSDVYDLSMKKN